MDPLMQRLQIAQDLLGALLGFLSGPSLPPRAVVQGALDAASAKLQAVQALDQPQAPLVAPQFLPAAAVKA